MLYGQKSSKLNSRLVYCSRLYGRFNLFKPRWPLVAQAELLVSEKKLVDLMDEMYKPIFGVIFRENFGNESLWTLLLLDEL